MWGRNRFQSRVDAAMDFINTGSTAAARAADISITDSGGSWAGQGGSGCADSSQCGSGYMCIGGRCVPPGDTGASVGYGTSSGSSNANCPPDPSEVPPPIEEDCGTDSPLEVGPCSKPSCGSKTAGQTNAEECCGERCCRSVAGIINCFCGPCPPPGRCQEYCDAYYKSNGETGEGCSQATQCTECETCQEVDGTAICEPIQSGAPCHCGGNNACKGTCEACGSDGVCRQDCDSCLTCVTIYNQFCSCIGGPPQSATVRCCTSACEQQNLNFNNCRSSLCNKICPTPPNTPEPDPCEGKCFSRTCCVTGSPPDCDQPPCAQPSSCPACPPKSTCTNLGFISAGGETCYLEQVCDKSNVPEFCQDPKCHCDDDCPDCQLCGGNGECYDNPECDV